MTGTEKVYFRTRGGPRHGWGNVYRLASFAEFCRTHSEIFPHFIVEGPPEVANILTGRDFAVTRLLDDLSISEEAEVLSTLPRANTIVMEMLDGQYDRQKMLKEFTDQLVVLDDLMDHRYCADKVICAQKLPDYGNRDISDLETQFYLGLDYFVLGNLFKKFVEKERVHNADPRKALVTLGGGRYDAAYLKCANALAQFPDIEATIVLGPSEKERLGKEISKLLPTANIRGHVDNIAELMWSHDIAIVSAGYTKIEAAITQTPAIMIATQWHQIPLGDEFHTLTGMPFLGYMSFFSVSSLNKAIADYLPILGRQEAAQKACHIVDGNGEQRVFDLIFANAGRSCQRAASKS
ncbi:MAG: hypothetical protein CMM52_16465 [Rhodospirillaceae bacterium]|nr:hypothetical protein [Rhodospirillaceae bacterium]|tara:strand:- start:7964 stop:9016 length:1053 start_codon:yes stop_codon:yes gene_type:complete